MIKLMLNIFNLNNRIIQIRSKQMTSGTSTKQRGMSFELSEFQPGTIKQTSNMRVYESQIRIVINDHITVITWLGTHIIMHRSKRRNFGRNTFTLKIQPFVFMKNLAKQLVLVVKGIFKVNDSKKRHSGDRSSLTSELKSEMCREDFPMR
jgi:hypothetical protein